MIKISSELYKDKVHACWIGKNIGGTMGTPFEAMREMQDIQGFSTPQGMPLANDDLDLQLVWLLAMEKHGPYHMSSRILSEYWVSYIPPHWNEYGIGKSNLKAGLLPPMSGEYKNEKWKHSNGAWIRSEVWACMAPGCPDVAIKYAFMDASVDHGLGEGTYAELFTAAIESAAFFESDLIKLINIGLSKIPADCRVAKSINLVLDLYEKGVDWKIVRNRLVEESADIGWFQAPANLGFVILGLLYGKGDFKQSLIYAINCGDDTDCTGATVGAILGLINGTKGIPQEMIEHIGDSIKTVAVDGSCLEFAKSCSELTDRIFAMTPVVMKANHIDFMFTEKENFIDESMKEAFNSNQVAQKLLDRSPYSYDIDDLTFASVRVEFEKEPIIAPDEEIQVKIRLCNMLPDPRHVNFKLHLPEGWMASRWKRSMYMDHQNPDGEVWTVTLKANENVEAMNRVIVEIAAVGRPSVGLIPITILG